MREIHRTSKFLSSFMGAGILVSTLIGTAAWADCSQKSLDAMASRFIVNGGEIRDSQTGLIWQRCDVGHTWTEGKGCAGQIKAVTWDQAVQTADGWRLPSKEEVQSLMVPGCTFPAMHTTVFGDPETLSYWIWTGSTTPDDRAAVAYPNGGAISADPKTQRNAVRLVRPASAS